MKRAAAAMALALAAIGAAVADPRVARDQLRVYPVKGADAFALRVPLDWKQKYEEGTAYPKIEFRPVHGPDYAVRVEVLPAKRRCRVPCDLESVRLIVGNAAREVKVNSFEPELKLETMPGREPAGYYFLATDRAPKAGEFKFLTQGVVAPGELVVTFRILTNDQQEHAVRRALEVLAGGRQVKLPPEKPAPTKAMPEQTPQKKP